MKVLLGGNIARDAAMANRLVQEGCEVYTAAEFANPSLVEATQKSEGELYVATSISNPLIMGDIAVAANVDLFLTNSDEALANGVVDEVRKRLPELLIASPDRASSQIEWDKVDTREIVAELDRELGTTYNPLYFAVTKPEQVGSIIEFFEGDNKPVVIKPRGLTGGKGVRVMGHHLKDYTEAWGYALYVLDTVTKEGVLIEEKLQGHEFTIQGITDGKTLIVPPVTYDYPYREDGDKGPGTGGMGSFTMGPSEQLPFLTQDDYDEAVELMRKVLAKQTDRGRDFKGVLYGSFFKTADGLKVVEFNSRIGDPEGINIMELLSDDVSLADVLQRIANQELRQQDVRFKRLASTAIYLVSPDYARSGNSVHCFELDTKKIASHGCRTYFAAAEQTGLNHYKTAGASRTVALASRAPTPWEARAKIHEAIRDAARGPLQYRHDVADESYIKNLG